MSPDLTLRRLAVALALVAFSFGTGTAEEPKAKPEESDRAGRPEFEASQFLRIVRDADGKPAGLETATVRYVPAGAYGPRDLVVDLVAVTHVGEMEYFTGIEGQLADYDAVLYELVAPEGAVPQPGANAGAIPGALKGMLELEYQTERIDYTRKNFVHADLTPQQIGEKMRERGQTGFSVAMDALGAMLADAGKRATDVEGQDELAGFDLTTLLFDPNGKTKLKRAFAVEIARAEMEGALGETIGRMLITDRNEAAVGVLRKQIDTGRRRIAIFYGAGHMPDLERRLVEDFRLERQGAEWREAWDLGEVAGE